MSLPTLLERIRDKHANDPMWTIAECPTGHDLMRDDPGLTTRLLLDSLAVSA